VAYRELHYRFNLREMTLAMERVGARVILASIGQNLSDWPPGASLHRRDLSDAELRDFDDAVHDAEVAYARGDLDRAVASYRRAIAIDDGFAQTHFDLARLLRDLARIEEARRHFALASDLDQVPHGAHSTFNDTIAEVARERGATFMDVAAELRRRSGTKLVGDDLFVDMVHPNLLAHLTIARSVFDGLRREDWPPGARWEPLAPLPSPDELLAADPHLRFLEQHVRAFACQLAMRPACAEDAAAAMRALEPENPIIESLGPDLGKGRPSR
jgi:tetratricopeptide (TPR) repeat protein